jgi:hypothetical protein
VLPPGIVQSMRASARDIAVLRLARRFRRNQEPEVAPGGGGVSDPTPGPGPAPVTASPTADSATPLPALLAPFMEPVVAPGGGSDCVHSGVVVVDTLGNVVSVSVGLLTPERGTSLDAAAGAVARSTDAWLDDLVRVCMRYLLADALCNTLAAVAKAVASAPSGPMRPAVAASRRLLGDLCVALDAWRKDALAQVNAAQPSQDTWTLIRAMDLTYRASCALYPRTMHPPCKHARTPTLWEAKRHLSRGPHVFA